MAIDEPRPEARSRRTILTAALGGLAGLIGGRFASPDRTSAAHLPGFGHANAAGAADTSLTASTPGTALLVTQSGSGTALRGSATGPGSIAGFFTANNGTGISGVTGAPGSYGVFASNNGASGSGGALRASGVNNHGVVATTAGPATADGTTNAVRAVHSSTSAYAVAISGETAGSGTAIWGTSNGPGVGVYGVGGHVGVLGYGDRGVEASGLYGGFFNSFSSLGAGVFADGETGVEAQGLTGLLATGTQNAIYAQGPIAGSGYAGVFIGDVNIVGTLTKTSGTFRIDHPLDPANKYLSHSFVESPDMLNVYSGTVTTDGDGRATVDLPDWFEAVNRDFRYQLTVLSDDFAQAIVSSKVKANRFSIRTDRPKVEISWQVTGIRHDVYAREHPIVVEQPKAAADRGKYIYPQGFGQPESAQISRMAPRTTPKPTTVPRS